MFVKTIKTRNFNDITLALKHRGGIILSIREVNGYHIAKIQYEE